MEDNNEKEVTKEKENKEKDKEEMDSFKADLKERSLKIITEIFPQKAIELTKFIQEIPTKFDNTLLRQQLYASLPTTSNLSSNLSVPISDTSVVAVEQHSKKRKLEDSNGSNNGNNTPIKDSFALCKTVLDMKSYLKKEATLMIDYATFVKLWIQFNIPRIEDGNNFGVQVQEDMLNNLIKAEENAFTATDQLAKYHLTRAKMITKIISHPEVEDYKETVYEIDEKCYTDMLTSFKDLRYNYAVLHDTLSKNLDKILKPRSSHTSSMF